MSFTKEQEQTIIQSKLDTINGETIMKLLQGVNMVGDWLEYDYNLTTRTLVKTINGRYYTSYPVDDTKEALTLASKLYNEQTV